MFSPSSVGLARIRWCFQSPLFRPISLAWSGNYSLSVDKQMGIAEARALIALNFCGETFLQSLMDPSRVRGHGPVRMPQKKNPGRNRGEFHD